MSRQHILKKFGVAALFVLLLAYWAYLVAATQPVLIYDALGYRDSGRMLMEQGWPAYFKGLNREPVFAYLISLAMRAGQAVGIEYTYILKVFLLIGLGVAMAGTYRLARLMGARRVWAGAGAFYLGASPCILNSTLWLWSEAAAYPFVVWGVVWLAYVWREMRQGSGAGRLAWKAGWMTLLFIMAAMVKAPVATVFVCVLLPFYAALVLSAWRRDWRMARRALLVVLTGLLLMGACIENYKYLNWRGHGQYAVTGRADLALFGNTVRRLHPDALTFVPQAVLAVPRLGICEKYYATGCGFWSAITSDRINDQYAAQLKAQGLSHRKHEIFIETAFRLMREHPFQETFFAAIEGVKMFFWENRLWFVQYPDWLRKIHANNVFVYTLSFLVAGLSLTGLVCALYRVFRYRRLPEAFAVLFVCFFIGSYVLFFIDIRYGFPLAPVFCAMIAAMGKVKEEAGA